ncbi:MAG: site-specific integrase [Anaerostipes sp.]|nr:site-specific integrase [Anaerostipes sp.]
MRLPNGFGNVSKLPGKRRLPYRARKTIGWVYVDNESGNEVQLNEDTDLSKIKQKQVYLTVGYFKTKPEAIQALADYNKDPYEIKGNTITFAELWEKWFDEKFEDTTISNAVDYKAKYKLCEKIKDMKFVDIKLNHLQMVVDESKKNKPSLRKLKSMFNLMYGYAVKHEIVPQSKADLMKQVDISKAGNPNAYNRKPFTESQVGRIWKTKDSNIYLTVVLILLYSGVRISELLDLKKENIHLAKRWFFVEDSKTPSGIREVPIAEKIVPFFEYWLSRDCEYLICTPENQHFKYRNYYDSYWIPLMLDLKFGKIIERDGKKPKYEGLTPHCARHTCISMLATKEVDDRVIKSIVGHKGQGVTQIVYTHYELPIKLDAINRI